MKCFFLLLPLVFIVSSCSKYHVIEGPAQGTTFRVVYEGTDYYSIQIYELLQEFDMALSTYQDSSLISRLNRNERDVELNDLFVEFFKKSKEAYKKSEGYFDITVGPLVKAWGFGVVREFEGDSSSIDSIKNFIGMDKIKIDNNELVKDDPRIYIDGNAIAQGQSVDFLASFLESQGVENYLVEIGGEVKAKGVNKEGRTWRIGIDKPIEDIAERELQAIVELKDRALATSGNYRKSYELNGIKYSHSINPKTGYPTRDVLLSASILAGDCSLADAYATACMVMGYEKARAFIESQGDLEAYFIISGSDGGYDIYQTEGFKKCLDE